jgi:hypothetical protein
VIDDADLACRDLILLRFEYGISEKPDARQARPGLAGDDQADRRVGKGDGRLAVLRVCYLAICRRWRPRQYGLRQ